MEETFIFQRYLDQKHLIKLTYFLSLSPVLVDIAHHFKKLQQDFLYRGLGGESKFHLVKETIILLQCGGLGIKKKHGSMWGGWCSNSVMGPYSVSLWKNIRRG